MSKANNLTDFLTNIANAIRAKKGTSATINPQDFETEIEGFSGKLKEYVNGTITTVTAQDLAGVTEIVPYRFYRDKTLQSITFPETLIKIGSNTFTEYGVFSLQSVNFGNSVQEIGSDSFTYCRLLTEIILPNSLKILGYNDFYGCNGLISVDIGNGITTIANNAFAYCSSLTAITIRATTPPTLGGTGAFTSTNNCPIYVPSASVDAYKAATNWSSYASRIQAIQ